MTWTATVTRTARPSEPPTWRELFSSPEAIPVSSAATSVVAAVPSGTKQSPMPNEQSSDGPRTETRKDPSTVAVVANQPMPSAAVAAPSVISRRTPRTATARVARIEPATTPAQNGRNANPAAVGPKPRTSCR